MTYLTIKLFAEKHKAFSEKALRQLIFHEHENGLHVAIRRIGRKVLIDEDCFLKWIEDQNVMN